MVLSIPNNINYNLKDITEYNYISSNYIITFVLVNNYNKQFALESINILKNYKNIINNKLITKININKKLNFKIKLN